MASQEKQSSNILKLIREKKSWQNIPIINAAALGCKVGPEV